MWKRGREEESKGERRRSIELYRQTERNLQGTLLASDSWKVAPGFPKNVRWPGDRRSERIAG